MILELRVTLRYVALRYVTLRCVTLRHVTLCHVKLCNVTSRYIMLLNVILRDSITILLLKTNLYNFKRFIQRISKKD